MKKRETQHQNGYCSVYKLVEMCNTIKIGHNTPPKLRYEINLSLLLKPYKLL